MSERYPGAIMRAGPALIVSASAGTGHLAAGSALAEAVRTAGVDAQHVDVLELAPRWVRAAYGGGFELLASHAPRVWREVYQLADGPERDAARWGPVAQRLIFRAFRRLLESRPWSFCACTHFLPGQLAAGRTSGPPFASIITDFTLHRYWVQPRVGRYFTATPELARALHARLPGARVVASGIPVAATFSRNIEQGAARAAAGLSPDARIALVMGGGMGLGVEAAARAALAAGVPGLQVVAVCGRNRAAYERLTAAGIDRARLRVLGYVPDVATLIGAADVVVTKPGGLTCSETLAVGRPLILSRAIPGHEEGNVSWLTSTGSATYAPEPDAMMSALHALFGTPHSLARATAAARAYGTPGAARAIAAELIRDASRRAVA